MLNDLWRDKISIVGFVVTLNKAQGQFIFPGNRGELEATEFILTLPQSVIRLALISRPYQPDAVSMKLLDKNERLAGTWNVEEGEDDWPIALELFEEVSKQVIKWDKVLDDVETFIHKSPQSK